VAEEEKAPPAKAGSQAPFQASWQESFGESSKVIRERWDKAAPDERKRILKWHPLLSARPLKHHWVSATPEERAAFLEAHPKTVQKVKEAWESATPEQRKMLALEHPYFARKGLYHAWMQATPQEKIAFLTAHPSLSAELKTRWTGATAWQKQWYARNYPGLESVATGKSWADTTTEERAIFLEANPGNAEKVREAWQKAQPEMRATLVKKWQGWPLRAYNAKLEKASKPLVSAKPRAPATTKKVTATAPTKKVTATATTKNVTTTSAKK
jgi:2-oxo-4-hydroxy-4-carboxy--5-ureidoimidazoline (OHCU) decarboxylase